MSNPNIEKLKTVIDPDIWSAAAKKDEAAVATIAQIRPLQIVGIVESKPRVFLTSKGS